MSRSQKRLGYLTAIVAACVVLAIRMALNDVLVEQARLMPFVLAVMAAAWWGGFGPGLFATLLSVMLGLWFIVPPHNSVWVDTLSDGVNAGFFVFIGVTISLLFEALHAAHRRDTQNQFRTLADSIPQLVWMARPDGFRFWFNQRWHDYAGPSAALAGDGWQTLFDPQALPRVLSTWRRAVASGNPWEETYTLRRCDGQLRWHLARAVPVRGPVGEIVCWFGTSTDIQDRMEVEQALRDSDARKDQFLATLAHELRNPLSPISNALQLWPYVAHDGSRMEHLREVMQRQLRQLVRLIDDLMDLSRITRGKIVLQVAPVDIHEVVAAAIETVQPMIDALDQQLLVNSGPAATLVEADAARLTQVFANLLNNASKYTGRNGAITITIESHDDQVSVSVADNGPGIPAVMLEEIFEPFRQVDGTLERAHGGLGIGLSLARQLVELQGGTVCARSAGLGQGSQFVVCLKAAIEPAASDRANPAPAEASTVEIHRHRILVVDDQVDSAQTLALVLRTLGQEVDVLHDGRSAVEWAAQHAPDFVFLDVAMPGLDGYEVARRMRTYASLHDAVLVALTGFGQPEDRRRALAAGCNAHLTKPTTLAEIKNLLASFPVHRTLSGITTA